MPERHRRAPAHPQRYFEDFTIGEVFDSPSRTVLEAHFSAFQAVSGDNHPSHYDRPFCLAHGHPDLLVHGFQVLVATAAGAGVFPFLVEDSMLGFIEQSSRFLRPVYPGDTLYPRLTVAELRAQQTTGVVTLASTLENQRGEIVMDGLQRYLLKRRIASGKP